LRRLTWYRLPILTKDLTEQAQQKRTYLIRFAYAFVLFVTACALFYANMGVSADAGTALGRGRLHFSRLLIFQIAALYLVVPLLTAGAITAEKQSDTLVLLLLTTLTPRQIVVQKFASRMTPILTFVCLSFPLLAITYTFGGVTLGELIFGILLLISTCVQLGAFAILCSAYCVTTAQSLVATYLGFAAFLWIAFSFTGVGNQTNSVYTPATVATGFGIFFTVACLSYAESVLVRRAFASQRNYVLEFFRWLDRIYERMNVVTGGVVLVRDRGVLPRRAPIRWRETRKKSLGTFRYLFRVLVALELPLLFLIQWIRLNSNTGSRDGTISFFLYLVWVVSAILVAIHSASLISAERSRQTLSVLLVSPMSARRILGEKLSGVHRLIAVLAVPFATIFVFERWWFNSSWFYIVLSALTVTTYLSVVQWLALTIGLRVRNQLPAIVITLSVVVVWTAGLASVIPVLDHFQIEAGSWVPGVILAFSPADMIVGIQQSAPQQGGIAAAGSVWNASAGAVLFHFSFYGALYLMLRWRSRYKADRRLGRILQPSRPLDRSLVPGHSALATQFAEAGGGVGTVL